MNKALQGIREADLLLQKETERGEKLIWEYLDGLHWHENFHVGQFEMVKEFIQAQCGGATELRPV